MKIAITGPESSGKTTFANALAKKLEGTFIPEFAREYLGALSREYTQDDLDRIATGQIQYWYANAEKPILVCDTEMLVMHIWSEVRFNSTSNFILEALEKQSFDHYFLCSPDIPWEEDPLREHPEMRFQLFDIYLEKLEVLNLPFTILNGTESERLEKALYDLGKCGWIHT